MLNGREKDGFTYPVAMYDHDEGRAVTGGFAYHGRIAALRGKFVFGDIQNGRLFAADLAELKKADDGSPSDRGADRGDPALRAGRERQPHGCVDAGARRSHDGREPSRADLHISRTRDGELLLTSRQDGMIRMLVPDPAAPGGELPRRR